MSVSFKTPAVSYLVPDGKAWQLMKKRVAGKTSIQVGVSGVQVAGREVVVTDDCKVLAINVVAVGQVHQVAEVHQGTFDDKSRRLQFSPADLSIVGGQLVVSSSDGDALTNGVEQVAGVDPVLVAARLAKIIEQKDQASLHSSDDNITLLEQPAPGARMSEFVKVTLKGRAVSRDFAVFTNQSGTFAADMATSGRKIFLTGRMVALTDVGVTEIDEKKMLREIKRSTPAAISRRRGRKAA